MSSVGTTALASPEVAGLFDPATGQTNAIRMTQIVNDMRSRGLSSGMIVDHLVAAYCPSVAAQSGLSDNQRAHLVRRFAREATGYVYTYAGSGETAVLVDVPLSPDLLDRVNQAAVAAKASRDNWITNAIVNALPK
jgi:hypothetical protein